MRRLVVITRLIETARRAAGACDVGGVRSDVALAADLRFGAVTKYRHVSCQELKSI